jgi:LysM repeat protein
MTLFPVRFRSMLLIASLLLLVTISSGCGLLGQESPTEAPTAAVEAPAQEPAEVPATNTPEPIPTEEPATPTSPVPTPTSPLASTEAPPPTPTPMPPPEPTFYTIQPGDSLVAIAQLYEITPEAIAYANGYASTADMFLIAGQQIQIPLCEAHQLQAGNTLFGIALSCDVSLDDLITANIAALAPLGTLDAIPIGFVLVIPPPSDLAAAPECAGQPAREQVIEYTPEPAEGIFCLSQMFGLSTTSIIQANIERLAGDNVFGTVPLLIPPVNGAVYTVTGDDVANSATLADIAEWYEVAAESIVDWNGNPVTDPLSEGQQIFIPGANLAFGLFVSQPPVTEPITGTEGTTNDNVNVNDNSNANDNSNDNDDNNTNDNTNSN